jgi:hypothetical protein
MRSAETFVQREYQGNTEGVSTPRSKDSTSITPNTGAVSIERTFYCDGPDCERHVRTAATRPTASFIFVTLGGSAATLHFCNWDCVLRYAAAKPPVEVVSLNDG